MRFFNILLKSNKQRVSHVFNHLKTHIPNLEIFPAVEGSTNQLEYLLEDRIIHPKFLKFCRRGQLACLFSHLSLWKKMVKENIPEAVILEDDAVVQEDFLEELQELEIPEDADFLYFFVHPDSKKPTEQKITPGYPSFGTVGYYLTLQTAQELINVFSKNINRPLDETISWYLDKYNKTYYCIGENLVETSGKLYHQHDTETELGSSIGETEKYDDPNTLISPTFYIDQGDYLCFPCCDVSGTIMVPEFNLKEKYLDEPDVIAFNSDGGIKTELKEWRIDNTVSLYVKSYIYSQRRPAILLTGGCGYIGSHCLLELLLNRNEDIVIVDDLSNSSIDNIDKIKDLGNVFFYEIDLKRKEDLDDIFFDHNIQSVIHFAGHKSVGESVSNPLKYYDNNIGGLVNLLECMKYHQVESIIFSSSATVYGNPESLPLTEESRIQILNPYGRTKYFSEEILRDMKDMKVICLRYFNPAGIHSSKLLKESPKGIPNNLFPYILSVLQGKKEYLNIYGGDYPTVDGTGVRDYIHVVDLAQGHLAALDYLGKMENNFEVFNLGTGKGYSVLEIVKAFSKHTEVPYKIVEKREGDAAEVYADCSKAEKLLNWKSQLTLDEMIKDLI